MSRIGDVGKAEAQLLSPEVYRDRILKLQLHNGRLAARIRELERRLESKPTVVKIYPDLYSEVVINLTEEAHACGVHPWVNVTHAGGE